MATQLESRAAPLYERDRYAWALEQAAALRAGRLVELDRDHLLEALEDLALSDWRAARSLTRNIIEHLLKLEVSPAQDPRNGWRRTVRAQRQELRDVITRTLQRRIEVELPDLYARVRRDTAETLRDHGEAAAADALPSSCPYTLDDLLGDGLPPNPRPDHERGAP